MPLPLPRMPRPPPLPPMPMAAASGASLRGFLTVSSTDRMRQAASVALCNQHSKSTGNNNDLQPDLLQQSMPVTSAEATLSNLDQLEQFACCEVCMHDLLVLIPGTAYTF
jgi:hypothetical protein